MKEKLFFTEIGSLCYVSFFVWCFVDGGDVKGEQGLNFFPNVE